ncbi:hypothetical protein ABE61_21045 [Lysinibacillus sphaericus]|uniref:hypothetical protein n=1 Tax=Lysinibacillus sphaericus TaxID=1421 RepID=UPI0018CE4F73|nr:hypothetical protein [Lysinibacillus sphaericus]MBG9456433.1 hypothetical protein [Lysinibacillus sphaericus]MBG9476507.1 hypothetical protein [Lysinibacillus sphaericus]MBG9594629.1 hypothetical protein [Lysinibacillus sphaericus]
MNKDYNNAKLKTDIRNGLINHFEFFDLHKILTEYKGAGGKQNDAYAVLESLREDLKDDNSEDILLELLDVVVGFCSPHIRIWD